MEGRVIHTDGGNLELVPVTPDQFPGVARYWPMGPVVSYYAPRDFYGLVFQDGEEEVWGIKLQHVEAELENACILHVLHKIVVAMALPHYLAQRHPGVMVPCPYVKEKPRGDFETGIALFVGPDAASRALRRDEGHGSWERRLGEGATAMVDDMLQAIWEVGQAVQPRLPAIIGADLRPRLAVGGITMQFLVEGPRVVVINSALDEEEPFWEVVVRAGFSRLEHAPMAPAERPNSAYGFPSWDAAMVC